MISQIFMNKKKVLKKVYKANKHGAITAAALVFIALCQVPTAIKNYAEVSCIGQTSNTIWRKENNHSEANMIAVNRCNGSAID